MFKIGEHYVSIHERYDIVEFVSVTKIAVFRERPEGRMISHYVGTEDEIALVRQFVDLGAEFSRRDITSGAMRRRMERSLDADEDVPPIEYAIAQAVDRLAMAVERVSFSVRRQAREQAPPAEQTVTDPLPASPPVANEP